MEREQRSKAEQPSGSVLAEIFRAAARPAVTVIFAAVIAQVVVEGIEAPGWFLALAIPVISWWFGERTVTRLAGRKAAKE